MLPIGLIKTIYSANMKFLCKTEARQRPSLRLVPAKLRLPSSTDEARRTIFRAAPEPKPTQESEPTRPYSSNPTVRSGRLESLNSGRLKVRKPAKLGPVGRRATLLKSKAVGSRVISKADVGFKLRERAQRRAEARQAKIPVQNQTSRAEVASRFNSPAAELVAG